MPIALLKYLMLAKEVVRLQYRRPDLPIRKRLMLIVLLLLISGGWLVALGFASVMTLFVLIIVSPIYCWMMLQRKFASWLRSNWPFQNLHGGSSDAFMSRFSPPLSQPADYLFWPSAEVTTPPRDAPSPSTSAKT